MGRATPRTTRAPFRDADLELIPDGPARWRIARRGAMRVPGIVFASRSLLPDVAGDQALEQVANVATLPGVVEASYAMPDIHWGYGFPIGGVAATDVDRGGVISPGGVGFDISCGVRLLTTSLQRDDLAGRMSALMNALEAAVPHGLGEGGVPEFAGRPSLDAALREGARAVVERGFGVPTDLTRCEDGGALPGAAPEHLSERALERGVRQMGSLGSGNHFLEVQAVERLLDEQVAAAFGLRTGQVCVMIHCGSRGLGHQICSDHVRRMDAAMGHYGIVVPDRQLACAPVDSPDGRAYLGAMVAAANFGRANRQLITHAVRTTFRRVLDTDGVELLYDVSHNLAKLERHEVDGNQRLLCVHRKGATRALAPSHRELPAEFAPFGQPVLVPGSMGTASYVLAGRGAGAFDSACHGAG